MFTCILLRLSLLGPEYAHGQSLYLMTSPEFHMKRLLAAGSGSIYQIGKSFRNEENGRHHNPEFTMLEWYRTGFDHHDLMNEMDQLLQQVLPVPASATCDLISKAFLTVLEVCPLEATMQELKQVAATLGLQDIAEPEEDRDTLLQLLFSVGVEPEIGQQTPVCVFRFSGVSGGISQKLIRMIPGLLTGSRSILRGLNWRMGFTSWTMPKSSWLGFEADNQQRISMGLAPQPIDFHLIEALQAGLPACAGVALGIDRLIMLALGCDHIDQVTAFAFPRA